MESRRHIAHRVQLPVVQIQPLKFFTIERPSTAAAKHRQLVPALIHSAVTIDTL
jgi:hypothetical protein